MSGESFKRGSTVYPFALLPHINTCSGCHLSRVHAGARCIMYVSALETSHRKKSGIS